ncbi:MAG: pantetheine-phosphate adenylyltransferase [Anaerolineae bacterium]
MTTALYPASFDPITFGHVDIAERAAKLFDEVVVGVFDKPLKSLLFSPAERYEMTTTAVAHIKNVTVTTYGGLTAIYAKSIQADVIVRGLRAVSDFEYEMQLALANRSFAPEVDTLCLMTGQRFSFISSSIVKEIALNGGVVDHLVPPHVVKALNNQYRQKQKAKT